MKKFQEGEDADRRFKRYELSDAKTFESLFFPQKDALLKLVLPKLFCRMESISPFEIAAKVQHLGSK